MLFQVNLFIANNFWKFEVPKVTGSVLILRLREVTFRNLSILWPNLTKMTLQNVFVTKYFDLLKNKPIYIEVVKKLTSFFKNEAVTW